MEIGSIGSQAAALPRTAPALESEAAERVPDNEAGEAGVPKSAQMAQLSPDKAPLPSYAGNIIDTQA